MLGQTPDSLNNAAGTAIAGDVTGTLAASITALHSVMAYGAVGNGVTDDTAAIQAALNANAGIRFTYIPRGTYLISSPLSPPSNTIVVCAANVVFHSTIPNTGGGGYTGSLFYTTKSNVGAANNLTANAVIGTDAISVTTAVAVNSTIAIVGPSGNLQQQVTVIKVAGGGLNLTLDEDIAYNYFTTANGAYVYTFTPVTNVRLYFNGAKFYGTGDRVVEFSYSRYVYAYDGNVDYSLGNGVDGFMNACYAHDIACRDGGFERMLADGGSDVLSGTKGRTGIVRESSIRIVWRDCKSQNFRSGSGYAFGTFDCKNVTSNSLSARNNTAGFYYGANDASGTEGSNADETALFSSLNDNGYVFDKSSKVKITGLNSNGDTNVFTQLGGTPAVEVANYHVIARKTGTWHMFDANYGSLDLSQGTIDMTSSSGTKSICDWSGGAGVCRIAQTTTIAGDYGFYLEDGIAQTLLIENTVNLTSITTESQRIRIGTMSTVVLQGRGTGSPLNHVVAGVGSTYQRTDGGAATSFYVKESGTDATGWVAK